MVGEVSVAEANEIGYKNAPKPRPRVQPCEFHHSILVPYFMDRKLIVQRAVDKGITLDEAVEELRAEWLAS